MITCLAMKTLTAEESCRCKMLRPFLGTQPISGVGPDSIEVPAPFLGAFLY